MKLSDYVASKVVELGIKHVFMVTGGGAMHLNHSLGTHKELECIFNHHEQACAIAAEGYYRLTNKLALVNVTSGPGGTNAITGVYGAYVDSLGMIVISGQVKWETTVRSTGLPLRQYGDQELDIEPLVRPITKYAAMVTDPKMIRYHLEKAFYLAQSGRPGPCWLDIPLNIQGAQIDPESLTPFDPSELEETWNKNELGPVVADVLKRVHAAKRPVIYTGAGIRISGQHENFLRLVDKLGIPVVSGWNAHDVIWNDHPNYAGRPGIMGDRAGNFVAQNADLLLVLGSRLSIRQVSYNWEHFAREAYKIWVEIDENELKKPTVKPEMPIHANLKDFIPALLAQDYAGPTQEHKKWMAWSKERVKLFPTVLPEYWKSKKINPYCLIKTIFDELKEDQIVVTGNGSACVVTFQAAELKKGQRLYHNSGCATMGYDLPASIGAYKASGGKEIVCITGDGSLMMNLQELETIAGKKMPIKIFLINNNGYVSIFQTHRNFFGGVEVGGGPSSGVTFPDFKKVVEAFEIKFRRCEEINGLRDAIQATLMEDGPAFCEIIVDGNQAFQPKLSAKQLPDGRIISPPLEDLSPFLSRDVLNANMIIKTVHDEES